MENTQEMKLTRRMLVWMTPIGVAIGLYEAWHLAGGLVLLMALQMLILGAAVVAVVRVIRREAKESR
ncbi:MAG: hypothetical protein ABW278_08720 [Steroidobacteraceae bacterium]